jgi:hypothetical protein
MSALCQKRTLANLHPEARGSIYLGAGRRIGSRSKIRKRQRSSARRGRIGGDRGTKSTSARCRACRTVRRCGYPLPVRQPRLPPKKAERGGRRQSRWSLTTDGFAYLNHRRLCPPAASCRRGPLRNNQHARSRGELEARTPPICDEYHKQNGVI